MSAADPYERLLRWYPRAWREAHGEVLLALLRDADDDAGRARPTRSDAWSVRVHGLAERLTPTGGRALATAGALVSLVTVVNVFVLLGAVAQPPSTGWELLTEPWALVPLIAAAAAPALVSLGLVALLRSRGVLTPPASVLAAGAACAAWCLAAVTSSSFDVGFQRLDAGLEQTPFGAATFSLFTAAAAAGTAAAAAVWDGWLAALPPFQRPAGRFRPGRATRTVVAVSLGAVTAVVLGLTATAPGSVLVTGTAVAAACLLQSRRTPRPVGAPSRRRLPVVADGRRASAAGQLAVAGLTVGLVGLLLLFAGPDQLDALQARGALRGVPDFLVDSWLLSSVAGSLTAVAVGLVASPRWGWRTHLLVGATCTALLLQLVTATVVAFVSPDRETDVWPFLAGGLLVGLAAAAPLPRVLPGGAVVRWSTSALLGIASGLTVGTGALVSAPLLTPVAAGAVLLALLVSAARVRRPARGDGPAATGVAARP